MQVVIGSDHAEVAVTQDVMSRLHSVGHAVTDVGRFVYPVTQFLCRRRNPVAQFSTDAAFGRVAKLAAMEAS